MRAQRRQGSANHRGPRQPLDSHRVALHLSTATDTACATSGHRATRLRGDIDIVPAKTLDGFDAATDYVSFEVLLEPAMLQRVAQELDLPEARAQLACVHLLKDARLQNLLFALDAELQSEAPYGETFREGIELSVAIALLRRDQAQPIVMEPVSVRALERIAEFIDANLDSTLTLSRLAAVAGVSRSSLQRAFKRWNGMAVHQYVVHRRVQRARALVLQGADSLADIAARTGFAHQSHMTRWMRRLLSATPAELGSDDGLRRSPESNEFPEPAIKA